MSDKPVTQIGTKYAYQKAKDKTATSYDVLKALKEEFELDQFPAFDQLLTQMAGLIDYLDDEIKELT